MPNSYHAGPDHDINFGPATTLRNFCFAATIAEQHCLKDVITDPEKFRAPSARLGVNLDSLSTFIKYQNDHIA